METSLEGDKLKNFVSKIEKVHDFTNFFQTFETNNFYRWLCIKSFTLVKFKICRPNIGMDRHCQIYAKDLWVNNMIRIQISDWNKVYLLMTGGSNSKFISVHW